MFGRPLDVFIMQLLIHSFLLRRKLLLFGRNLVRLHLSQSLVLRLDARGQFGIVLQPIDLNQILDDEASSLHRLYLEEAHRVLRRPRHGMISPASTMFFSQAQASLAC
jgi:hypothetical protein